ncbi:MAG: hypothetical protein ACFFEJ_14395 [Candidatus Thorarchaeota archaeon]
MTFTSQSIILIFALALLMFFQPTITQFQITDQHDPGPTIFRSYLGSEDDDIIVDIEKDDQDSIYVVGYTTSPRFEIQDFESVNHGQIDILVAKISSEGILLFVSLLGGSKNDIPEDFIVDGEQNLVIVGTTNSLDLPTTDNAFQNRTFGQDTGFIIRLSPNGEIVYCSYFGGNNRDQISNVIETDTGDVVLLGKTQSHDFPLINSPRDEILGSEDFFIARFGKELDVLIISILWGSNSTDVVFTEGNPIILNSLNELVIGFSTNNIEFPQKRYSEKESLDPFLIKFSLQGEYLSSLYVNNTAEDDEDTIISSIVEYDSDRYCVSGTLYTWFVWKIDPEIFVTTLDYENQGARRIVFFDGMFDETVTDIDVNATGHIFILGNTTSPDFLRKDTMEEYSGGIDAFLLVLNPQTLQTQFTTYLGGVDDEIGNHFVLDDSGKIFLVGSTSSIDLIPVHAFQSSKTDGKYGFDGYVWCIDITKDSETETSDTTTTAVSIAQITLSEYEAITLVALTLPSIVALIILYTLSRKERHN